MKRKIISKISYGYVAISAIAAPWMAFADLRFLPTCIWGLGLMVATAGMFLTDEKENAPDERQLSRGQRKFYNIILAEGKKSNIIYTAFEPVEEKNGSNEN